MLMLVRDSRSEGQIGGLPAISSMREAFLHEGFYLCFLRSNG